MVYALNVFNLVSSRENLYREYSVKAGKIIYSKGGKVLSSAWNPIRKMKGDIERRYMILVEFPSKEVFQEFLNEAERSKQPPSDACSELFKVISQRKSRPDEASYTNKLFKKGDNGILKKIGEESSEFVMACKDKNKSSIANEAADLIYHLQVAMAYNDVQWIEVLKVLKDRRSAPRRE